MTFANLPGGAAIFLDANPFIYHYSNDPQHAAPSMEPWLDRFWRFAGRGVE